MEFSRRNLIINFSVWTIVALFTATQLYLKSLQANDPQRWLAIFKVQLIVWWIWGIITPLVFWIGNKFRVDKGKFWRLLVIHLPLAVVTVLVYLFIYAMVWNANNGPFNLSTSWAIWKILFHLLLSLL